MVLLVSALLAVPAALAEPRLTAPKGPLATGSAASFTLVADATGTVVDGCVTVELERREGDSWVPVDGAPLCDGSAAARAVSGSLTFTLATPGDGEFRGVAAWGTDCVPGRPFATAACKKQGVARSEAFTVGSKPAAP